MDPCGLTARDLQSGAMFDDAGGPKHASNQVSFSPHPNPEDIHGYISHEFLISPNPQ